ncbi:MAG: hypothetical protein Q7R34_05235, partial [Dehalococcoidia bacterium]|nr:hypothetical protein [Dehalococcoidia bacterium]
NKLKELNRQEVPMPRGGKRPGAGAPKHNFNSLKNGKYSDRMERIAALLLSNPHLRLIYKHIRANLIKEHLYSKLESSPLCRIACPFNSTNSTNPSPPRSFLAVFIDSKLHSFYLAPKNKKGQSNNIIIIYTQKWLRRNSIKQKNGIVTNQPGALTPLQGNFEMPLSKRYTPLKD